MNVTIRNGETKVKLLKQEQSQLRKALEVCEALHSIGANEADTAIEQLESLIETYCDKEPTE